MADRLYSLKEAAEIIGVSDWTVRTQYIKGGLLPAQKIGRSLVITQADLKDFLKKRETRKLDSALLEDLKNLLDHRTEIQRAVPELNVTLDHLAAVMDLEDR